MASNVEMMRDLLKRCDGLLTAGRDKDMVDEHLWNVLSALRGPDDSNSDLKWVTTARVRHILGISPGLGLAVNSTPEPAAGIGEFLASMHFIHHWQAAMQSLKALGYEVTEEELP